MQQLSLIFAFVIVTVLRSVIGEATDPTMTRDAELSKTLGKLQLVGGDVYRGGFGKKDDASGSLVWKCPAFASDLVIPWSAVESIVLPQERSTNETMSKLQFIVEMQNGETLTGVVTDINDDFVALDSNLAGKKRLPMSEVRSILRAEPTTESSVGELKIADWKQITPPVKKGERGNWVDRLGSYDTDTAGTVISQSVQFPDLAAIDINVSWQTATPNWLIQIGEPRKLEIHVRKLESKTTLSVTILVEDDTTADIATAQLFMDGSNAISLRVLCDSFRGRLVLMENGVAVAQCKLSKTLRLTGRQPVTFTNNVAGRLSLRSLKFYRSIFSSPMYQAKGKEVADFGGITSPETLLQNGQTFIGKPTSFDPADSSFGFPKTAEVLGRVALPQVDRIEFPVKSAVATPEMGANYFVQLWSGARYVGQSISIQSNEILISMEQTQSKVRIPLNEVMAAGQNGTAKLDPTSKEANTVQNPLMRFSSPWLVSHGRIVPFGPELDTAAAPSRTLNWKASKAFLPVLLADSVTGTIEPIQLIAKDEKSTKPKAATTSDFGRTLESDEPSLFLKSGDCFAAEIQSVYEGEMLFKSPLFNANKIDADRVRGVRKLAYTGADKMEVGSRKRLLTLPRTQRNNPPTHLIVSRDGDAIRGQLQSMDVDELILQVRGEDRKIQMKNVAEIVWLLDAPEIVPPGKTPTVPDQAAKAALDDVQQTELSCQALDSSGTRISIVPERVEGDVLYGQHPQLGPCQIALAKISKLVLGDAIADEAKRNRFSKWALENASDPKFVNDLDSPDANSGNSPDSPQAKLAEKPAPDFELKKLDGTLLKLSDLKGRVVVLDFWATWCGPCVASLPKITQLGIEYKAAEVDVIAVNIEQTSAEVQSFLDRAKISPTVVLDSDGAVARAYQAQAIPQTVIIDRDGKIKFVIVGGGGATETKIRDSLDGMLNLKL